MMDNRVDLSKEQYELLRDLLWSVEPELAPTLHLGEHEGSTIELNGLFLCQADNSFWLVVETDEAPANG